MGGEEGMSETWHIRGIRSFGECTICALYCRVCSEVQTFRDSCPNPSNAVDRRTATVLDGCCPSHLLSIQMVEASCNGTGTAPVLRTHPVRIVRSWCASLPAPSPTVCGFYGCNPLQFHLSPTISQTLETIKLRIRLTLVSRAPPTMTQRALLGRLPRAARAFPTRPAAAHRDQCGSQVRVSIM
jgi:hypothetical protein